ncbi:MAG: GNAT family N-acetyltransferase [Candidatus Baltobacteraceae bacterium]
MKESPDRMVVLRTLDVNDWQRWRLLRLQALTESPEAFSSTLADWQGEGDTEERWRQRLNDVPYNAIAELNGTDVGMVSATVPDRRGVIELISMWVAPTSRGTGAGDALVRSVIAWAEQQPSAKALHLCVVKESHRAIGLYERHGFTYLDDVVDTVRGDAESRMSLLL